MTSFGGFGTAAKTTTGAATTHNPNNSIEVANPPNDGVSALAWSSKANYLAAASWDNSVRCWEVAQTGQTQLKGQIAHDGPVLCVNWSADGTKIVSGGCDSKAKLWSLQTGQSVQIAQHAAPIKAIAWIDDLNMCVTGSWDKTLKYWDGRTSNPTHTAQLPERVYCMDVSSPLMVVGTADRNIIVFDLRKPQVEFKRIQSPLKQQSRVITCFPDKTGFALGSIEGRVAIHHVEDKDTSKNFAFKCHRDGSDIYSVNAISFHPRFGTFATAGSDGSFNFWDKENRQRLKQFTRANNPIPCAAFNMDGTIYAYSVSYDWYKGIEGFNQQTAKSYILLHPVQEADIKKREAVAARR
eukprot:TRINITY_DN10997_c0_g1_i1.p1 TRINITY_DN10997_c0_g1~~TRINITY_DN10997_c0_g1_i1.p1  ORF type:complete len:353 (+),score=84.85 TRINITY_DN10997_c0_g1_i1:102-1160(+)